MYAAMKFIDHLAARRLMKPVDVLGHDAAQPPRRLQLGQLPVGRVGPGGEAVMLYIALAAAAGLIGLDQLTKILIDSNMQLHQSIPIISFGDTNVLNITYERNPGAAFSILEGKQLFLILFTAVVIVVMLYLMLSKRVKKPTYIWSMSLIVAGGIGNLIDRVIRGEVVDFIDVRIINFIL